jgi:hypothetical protein
MRADDVSGNQPPPASDLHDLGDEDRATIKDRHCKEGTNAAYRLDHSLAARSPMMAVRG